MNPLSRSTLVLAGTFAVGAIFGVLLVGAIGQIRGARLDRVGRPGGFVEHMERVIRPRDEEQRAALRPILQRTERRNEQIMRGSNDQLRDALDEMLVELGDLIDDEQRRRLEEMPRRPPPPPAGGPPPRRR